jgi:hypothetical protein
MGGVHRGHGAGQGGGRREGLVGGVGVEHRRGQLTETTTQGHEQTDRYRCTRRTDTGSAMGWG